MQSRSGSTNYFNFSLQVSDTRKRRAVCYDGNEQSLIADFQDFRQPISLLNITEKPSPLDPEYNCNAFQSAPSCNTNVPFHIAIRNNKHQLLWLKDFPSLLEMLSRSSTDVNLQSSQMKIYEQLFQLRNITLHCSNTSDIVKTIHFDTSENS